MGEGTEIWGGIKERGDPPRGYYCPQTCSCPPPLSALPGFPWFPKYPHF